MKSINWKSLKNKKTILRKSLTFIVISVLIWQSFPQISSYAQTVNEQVSTIMFKEKAEVEKQEPVKELTIEEQMTEIILEVARQEEYDNPELLLAIAKAESRLNPNIKGEVDKRDRGLFQINSYYNSEVTDECAFDPWCSTRWVVGELKAGRHWKWNASRYSWGRYLTKR